MLHQYLLLHLEHLFLLEFFLRLSYHLHLDNSLILFQRVLLVILLYYSTFHKHKLQQKFYL